MKPTTIDQLRPVNGCQMKWNLMTGDVGDEGTFMESHTTPATRQGSKTR